MIFFFFTLSDILQSAVEWNSKTKVNWGVIKLYNSVKDLTSDC